MILAAICARGGSKGVPRKNLRQLRGRTLLAWAIESARACPLVDRTVVSTDDDEIAAAALDANAEVPFRRPADLASDAAPKWPVFQHLVRSIESTSADRVEILADLDVGVPLRTGNDIARCVERLRDTDADVVITAYEPERNPYFNMVEERDGYATVVKRPERPITRRQDAPRVWSLSPAVFAIKRDFLLTSTHWSEGRVQVVEMPRERAMDIDTPLDFSIVEALLNAADPIHAKPANRFRLDDRVAVITGGAGLLGEHFGRAFHAAGAHVVLADLDAETCARRAEALSAEGGQRAIGIGCDVSSRESLEAALATVMREFRRADVLLNGAAITNSTRSANYGAGFEDFPREDWDQALAVNLTGVLLGCQVFGRQMLAQNAGAIVNVASMYGVVSPTHTMYDGTGVLQPVSYSVSKAGVIALTRYLGTLWARRGIRVNALTPGGVAGGQSEVFLDRFSQRNPTGRMARPEEMGGAAVFLASDEASYCVGHNLVVDGGWTVW